MIEVIVNDRLGKKVRIKANPTDTVGDFKKLVAAQTGTRSVGWPLNSDDLSIQIWKDCLEEMVHNLQR